MTSAVPKVGPGTAQGLYGGVLLVVAAVTMMEDGSTMKAFL